MNQTLLEPEKEQCFTVEDWDTLRAYFKDSVMAKTNLCSLASHLGMKWPIRGKSETPERYLSYSLEALSEMPEFYGKGNRLPLLYSILLETKSLDDPFVEMTRHLDEGAKEEIEVPQLLRQLGVPAEFPVELINFTSRTHAKCREGGYETISQLVAFLQESASAAMINNEFRDFRNCLDQMDAVRMGQFLPIREGCRGIYLAEAIGHLGRRLSESEAATLVYAYKIPTTNPEWSENFVLSKAESLALFTNVKQRLQKRLDLMPDQAEELRGAINSGLNSGVRFFVPLNDSNLEGLSRAIAMASMDLKPRLKSLISSLLT